MNLYDRAYASDSHWFGAEPDSLFVRFKDRILKAPGSVLDLGAGQGRHSLPLSTTRKSVVAIDPSAESVGRLGRERHQQGLDLGIVRSRFGAISPEATFSTILIFGLIQELSRNDIRELAEQCREWCDPDGLLLITAFMITDPACVQLKQSQPMADHHSFLLEDGSWRNYLESGELLQLFDGFRSHYCRELWGPVHRHGDGPPERHARLEAALVPDLPAR